MRWRQQSGFKKRALRSLRATVAIPRERHQRAKIKVPINVRLLDPPWNAKPLADVSTGVVPHASGLG